MSFQSLISSLKGSSSSGNFGHSGRPGKKGGSIGGRLRFDSTARNDEISQILVSNPKAKPTIVTLSDKLKTKYSNQYDFWMSQDSTDAELLRNVESADRVPPIIITKTGFVTDGSHRMAVAAKHGMNSVLAYVI